MNNDNVAKYDHALHLYHSVDNYNGAMFRVYLNSYIDNNNINIDITRFTTMSVYSI